MLKKAFIVVLLLALMLSVSGCKKETGDPMDNPAPAEGKVLSFDTEEDFIKHIQKSKEVQEILLSKESPENVEANTVSVYLPNVPDNFELYKIEIEKPYILTRYRTEKPVNNELRERYDAPAGEREETTQTAEDMENEVLLSTTMVFVWNYVEEGKPALKEVVKDCELIESGVPGYYYAYYGLGYSVYWEENGHTLQVNFPTPEKDMPVKELIEQNKQFFTAKIMPLKLK